MVWGRMVGAGGRRDDGGVQAPDKKVFSRKRMRMTRALSETWGSERLDS